RAFITPFFGLRLEELADCDELPGTHPLLERLFGWRAIAEAKHYPRLFTRILEDSGVVRRALFVDEGERELTNYLHLFELLSEELHRTHATLRELVLVLGSYIDETAVPEGQSSNVQRLESERDAV